MSETNKKSFTTITFILSLYSFLFGLLPILGWFIVTAATILFVFTLQNKEKNGLVTASGILLALTWVVKVIAFFLFVTYWI